MASFEQQFVEAGFILVLAVATAVLHSAVGFHSPFPEWTGAPLKHDPLLNYLLLFVGAALSYLVARAGCKVVSALLPAQVKKDRSLQRGSIAGLIGAVILTLYGAIGGTQAIEQLAVVRWLGQNWELNGRSDVMWCVRLFFLLGVWQCLFWGLAQLVRVLWIVLDACVNGIAGAGTGSRGRGRRAKLAKPFAASAERTAVNERAGNTSNSNGGMYAKNHGGGDTRVA